MDIFHFKPNLSHIFETLDEKEVNYNSWKITGSNEDDHILQVSYAQRQASLDFFYFKPKISLIFGILGRSLTLISISQHFGGLLGPLLQCL